MIDPSPSCHTALPPPPASGPLPTLAASEMLVGVLVAGTALLALAALWAFDVIRPGSFRRTGRRETNALPWWGWLVAAFATLAAMFLGQTIGISAAGAAGVDLPATGPLPPRAATIVGGVGYAAAIATGAALIILLRRGHHGGRGAGESGLTLRPSDAFHALGWFTLVMPVVWLVSMAAAMIAARLGTQPDNVAHVTLRQIAERRDDPWIAGVIAIVVVAGPVTEEFIYRVFVQSGLLALLGRPWLAVALASLFFGAMHWSAADWYALPGLAVFGFALGLAYERTRRLGVPIVMHALFNLANVGLVLG